MGKEAPNLTEMEWLRSWPLCQRMLSGGGPGIGGSSSVCMYRKHCRAKVATCQEQSSGDGVQGPGYSGVSRHWQSPRLTDLQYVQLAAADRSVFDALSLNTVIATKDHRYGFSGGGCPATWTQTMKYQIQRVVSGNATNKYLEWKVVQR